MTSRGCDDLFAPSAPENTKINYKSSSPPRFIRGERKWIRNYGQIWDPSFFPERSLLCGCFGRAALINWQA